MAKKYKKNFIINTLITLSNGIWITQDTPEVSAFREIIKRLKNVGVLMIAPEGTRSKDLKLGKGKNGAAFLALKLGLPIIPAAIIGSDDKQVISNIKKLKKTKISFTFGEPIYLNNSEGSIDIKEQLEKSTELIMTKIAEILPEEFRGYYSQSK